MQSFTDVDLTASRILIVDDQEANVRLLEFMLESAGFRAYKHTTDSREVLKHCQVFEPDLLLLDLQMPHQDGFQVMAELNVSLTSQIYLPILVLTADITPTIRKRALAEGANDFLSKPLDTTEVLLRIQNLLWTKSLHQQLLEHNETLEARVRARTEELAAAQLEILDRLASASEYRDDDTGQHTHRVGLLTAMIARTLGHSEEQVELLRRAATLHDVGKIGIPDAVLLKTGRLTEEEFNLIKSHASIGAEILGNSTFSLLQLAREIALSHHEWWDGSGYPHGLKQEQIPVSGRIVAIADVFDALTHDRPYKKAWTFEAAIAEIKRKSGRHFDPRLVSGFLSVMKPEGLENLSKYLETGVSMPQISTESVSNRSSCS